VTTRLYSLVGASAAEDGAGHQYHADLDGGIDVPSELAAELLAQNSDKVAHWETAEERHARIAASGEGRQ
jgi:hypothetical protein